MFAEPQAEIFRGEILEEINEHHKNWCHLVLMATTIISSDEVFIV